MSGAQFTTRDRVSCVWMNRRVEAVVVSVASKGATTHYKLYIDGVKGHPWYREDELERAE